MAPCIIRSELCYLRGLLPRPPPDGLLVVLGQLNQLCGQLSGDRKSVV